MTFESYSIENNDNFLRSALDKYSMLDNEKKELLYKYYNTPYDRSAIALLYNMSLAEMMFDIFNKNGYEESEVYFKHKNRRYSFILMNGICDDYYGEKYCKFGTPFVIRIYMPDYSPIPCEIFSMADWNYMSNRKDGFIGYIYGSFYQNEIYVAGMQSDICQRYTYLYGQQTKTFYNDGHDIIYIENDLIVKKYKQYIPYIRRYFQREWLDIFMKSLIIVCYKHHIQNMNLLKYTRDTEGYIVDRIYNQHFNKFIVGEKFVHHQTYWILSLKKMSISLKLCDVRE